MITWNQFVQKKLIEGSQPLTHYQQLSMLPHWQGGDSAQQLLKQAQHLGVTIDVPSVMQKFAADYGRPMKSKEELKQAIIQIIYSAAERNRTS